jgi:hypothetical protein
MAKRPLKCQRCRKEPAIAVAQGYLAAWRACAKCLRKRKTKP